MTLAIRCGLLIDATGVDPLLDAAVLIDDERIIRVGRAADVPLPRGAEVLDLGDEVVLPGLIDAHTHLSQTGDQVIYTEQGFDPAARALEAARNLRRDLKAGVTTMRLLGERAFVDVAVRRAIERGIIPGPRLLIATRALHATNGHGYSGGFDGLDAIRLAVRENLRAGADVIKIMATGSVDRPGGHFNIGYSHEEIAAAVAEAHRAGKRVAAHAIKDEEICACLEAGVDTIEHGHMLGDRSIELLLRHDAWLVGTLAIVLDEELLVEDMRINPTFAEVEWLPRRRAAPEATRRAIAAGVKYASGTDGLHGDLAAEVEQLDAIGVDRMVALLSITRNAADACGILDRVGTVEPGKIADLISVRGNPLVDVAALRHVSMVMQHGRRYDSISDI